MNNETTLDKRNIYFKNDCKQIVDMLFDNKILKDGLTRDDMNGIEELMTYLLQSRFDAHLRAKELFDKIEKNKTHE